MSIESPKLTKFLVKNIASQEGIYRANGADCILQKGDSVVLDFPPEFASAELKVVEIKA